MLLRSFMPVALCLFIPASAWPIEYSSAQVERVTSIYDGDTFRVDIEEWPAIIGQDIPIRVRGINTPEMRADCPAGKELAQSARQFTVSQLRDADVIELRHLGRGKYFRILADVIIDGRSLAAGLIKSGLARPYDGGTRRGWCDSDR